MMIHSGLTEARHLRLDGSSTGLRLGLPGVAPVHALAGVRPIPDARLHLASGPLRVRIVDTLDGLAKMERTWDEVLLSSETPSPFLTHEWVLTWLECFGAEHQPWILVIEDDFGPCAIAPFARVERRLGPITYRCLELIGTGPLRFLGMGLSDRSDLMLARHRAASARLILRHLAENRDQWDLCDLRFLASTSTSLQVVDSNADLLSLGTSESLCSESPYLKLSGTFDDYLAGRSRNMRNTIRRKERRLAEVGRLEWDLDAARDPDRALRDAFTVTAGSWKAQHGSGLFTYPSVRQFFERLAPRAAARNRLSVGIAYLDGKPVAHEFGFAMAGKFWSYDHCYVQALGHYSPGHLMTMRIIEQAYATGLTEYDFLRGDEDYKLRWSGDVRVERQMVLDSGSTRAQFVRDVVYRGKWALKRSRALVYAQARVAGWMNRFTSRPA